MALKRTTVVEIEGSVSWMFARDTQSGTWVGVCPQLNLNAIGDTWAELLACAQDAMMVLFEDLEASGEFDQFLHRNGWKLRSHERLAGQPVKYDLPFDVQRRESVRGLAVAHG